MAYRGNRLLTNPPPSSGGMLIGFALRLLEAADGWGRHPFGSYAHLALLGIRHAGKRHSGATQEGAGIFDIAVQVIAALGQRRLGAVEQLVVTCGL